MTSAERKDTGSVHVLGGTEAEKRGAEGCRWRVCCPAFRTSELIFSGVQMLYLLNHICPVRQRNKG